MPSKALTRRRNLRPASDRKGARLGFLAVALSFLTIAGLGSAAVVLGLANQLPDVGRIEAQFGLRGAEHHRPLVVYDRTGEILLFQNLHPEANSRQWVNSSDLPNHVVDATIAILDPTFWDNPGYLAANVLAPDDPSEITITRRLAIMALMPPTSNALVERLGSSVLAAELTSRYPKATILDWFLNSADYGRSAYGLDAAALVYFGKSAHELTLSESALLAAVVRDPRLDPHTERAQAIGGRREVLQAMQRSGLIHANEAQRAAGMRLSVRNDLSEWKRPEYVTVALEQLELLIGRARLGRSGLSVISTIDHDLQGQSACVAESHLRRLAGEPIGTLIATQDDGPCVAASLLPTLRPGDAGIDHRVDTWGLVVMDPARGELLAAHGRFDMPQSAGPLLDPFIYLTAFAQGSTPATMVLDLRDDLAESRGPVRMRTALANLYPGASERVLSTVGLESFSRTLEQMGLSVPDDKPSWASLTDLTAAYGIVAAGGQRIGFDKAEAGISPTIVLRVEMDDGQTLYDYSPAEQAILSPQLAHLMLDVLSDESARWETLGQANLLEIGLPAGVVSGQSLEGDSNWTVGFTPQRVVGVWLGGSEMRGIDRQNGAAPIWHAVARFAIAGLRTPGWERPPGLTEMEVCDPSGLLPTLYCPQVVGELFIQGTEPTHFDTLFKPLRVNRETGKLATLFTPLDAVEERVFFVPPFEAQAWAELVGIEQPPEEYDTLSGEHLRWPGVSISSPSAFEVVGQAIRIVGEAVPEGFRYYRLQYGQGLNPSNWVQIGQDERRRVENARLGTWSTEGLGGLYTLQLLVVLADGQIRTAAIPITIDNQAPEVKLVSPLDGAVIRRGSTPTTTLQADALDEVELDRVEFWVDGRRVGIATSAPYTFRWSTPTQSGEYEVEARAYDVAGNRAVSETALVEIIP